MLREVPKELYVGHSWVGDETNREDLRLFLSQHQVDIHNTVGIVFRDKSFTVEVFVRDSQGRIKTSDRGVTLTTKKTVYYVGRRPDITPKEDWKRANWRKHQGEGA